MSRSISISYRDARTGQSTSIEVRPPYFLLGSQRSSMATIDRSLRLTASMGFLFTSELRHMLEVPHLRTASNVTAKVAIDRLLLRRGA